jgi:hypothetical protein
MKGSEVHAILERGRKLLTGPPSWGALLGGPRIERWEFREGRHVIYVEIEYGGFDTEVDGVRRSILTHGAPPVRPYPHNFLDWGTRLDPNVIVLGGIRLDRLMLNRFVLLLGTIVFIWLLYAPRSPVHRRLASAFGFLRSQLIRRRNPA